MIRCSRPGCARPAAYRLRGYRVAPGGTVEAAGRSLELAGVAEVLCGPHADKLLRRIATVPGARVEAERLDGLELDASPGGFRGTEPTDPQSTRRRRLLRRLRSRP